MSKADFESWIVVKGRRRGVAYAERRALNVPVALAQGRYEQLSALQLREALNDLQAEADRRNLPPAEPAATYDPLASQIRRPS